MRKVKVKIMTLADELLPEYKTEQAAGCDLKNAGNTVRILRGHRAFFRTGVKIQLPDGYEAQVRGRSGLLRDHGIVVPTGTVDADYRGEIGVTLINLGDEDYVVRPGERIAQLVIAKVRQAKWKKVDVLDPSARGTGGFGHTGRK